MMSMRITGGKFCGRKIIIPEGKLEIRPAMDRMRESLFSILGPLNYMSFLDLFSGSGCIGIEAASRGANPVTLVELDREKKETLKKNISFLKDENITADIIFANVFSFIKKCSISFSVVYADPPFPLENKQNIIRLISECRTVEENGKFIIHIPTSEVPAWNEKYNNLTLTDKRKYGRNSLLFYTFNSTDNNI